MQFRIAETYWRWEQWKVLFMLRKGGDKEEADERMNLFASTAPHLMEMFRSLLMNDITLRIAHMADPARTGKNANLSLARLLADAQSGLSEPEHARASTALQNFTSLAEKVGKRRNKVVAHADFAIETGSEAEPSFRSTDLDDCLAAAVSFMSLIDPERETSSFGYEHLIVRTDARHLIAALRDAKEIREQRKQIRSWK